MNKKILFVLVVGLYLTYLVVGLFFSFSASNLKKKSDFFAEHCSSLPINFDQCLIFFNQDIKSMNGNELEDFTRIIGKDNLEKTYKELHYSICKNPEQQKCKLEPLPSLEIKN